MNNAFRGTEAKPNPHHATTLVTRNARGGNSKDGQVTWFLGADNYFSHPVDDSAGHRLALATLMAKDTTLRKAIAAGRITKPNTTRQTAAPTATDPSTKSQRSRTDAQAAAAIGTACTRADDPLLYRVIVIFDREGSHHSPMPLGIQNEYPD